MSIYPAIVITAALNGIFAGYYIITGTNASLSGIGVKIVNMLEPLLPTEARWQADFYKLIILAIPWIFTTITILKAPNKVLGITIFIIVFIGSTLFTTFYLSKILL